MAARRSWTRRCGGGRCAGRRGMVVAGSSTERMWRGRRWSAWRLSGRLTTSLAPTGRTSSRCEAPTTATLDDEPGRRPGPDDEPGAEGRRRAWRGPVGRGSGRGHRDHDDAAVARPGPDEPQPASASDAASRPSSTRRRADGDVAGSDPGRAEDAACGGRARHRFLTATSRPSPSGISTGTRFSSSRTSRPASRTATVSTSRWVGSATRSCQQRVVDGQDPAGPQQPDRLRDVLRVLGLVGVHQHQVVGAVGEPRQDVARRGR